jgi:hypothetical protein
MLKITRKLGAENMDGPTQPKLERGFSAMADMFWELSTTALLHTAYLLLPLLPA